MLAEKHCAITPPLRHGHEALAYTDPCVPSRIQPHAYKHICIDVPLYAEKNPQIAAPPTEKEVMSAFEVFDTFKDNKMTVQDMVHMLRELGVRSFVRPDRSFCGGTEVF